MKNICLIKDANPYWRSIEGYLKNVGASVKIKAEASDTTGTGCDLIIGGENLLDLILPRGVPKLVVLPEKTERPWSRDVHFVVWPIEEERFLEMTARLLHLSERRRFKAVITVKVRDEEDSFMGRSEDFSLTGLAFKVEKELRKGDLVTVSFHLPESSQRASLDAEIVRTGTDPFDNSVYYGARFINLSAQDRQMLEKFIKKSRLYE